MTIILSAAEAFELDAEIQEAISHIGDGLEHLADLIAEAKEGNIHIALGLPSWAAYMETVTLPVMTRGRTRAAIEMLSDAGMSVRSISKMTGTSPSSAQRIVVQARIDAENAGMPKAPVKTTTASGKEVSRSTEARAEAARKSVVRRHLRSKPSMRDTIHITVGADRYKELQRIARERGITLEALGLEAIEEWLRLTKIEVAS